MDIFTGFYNNKDWATEYFFMRNSVIANTDTQSFSVAWL